MSIVTEIERPNSFVFRRAAIQRRLSATGLYDGVWQDISTYVRQWGTIESALDAVKLNTFTHSGVNLTVDNDTGAFNHHSNLSSLWFGYLGRYRTLVRIQAGYYDTDMTGELPADPTLGIFILDNEVGIKSNTNDVYLRCSSLKSVFDEVRASDMTRLFTTTAWVPGNIMATIRDHSDGAGNNVFKTFITSTAWTIDSTSANTYSLSTNLVEDMSTWDLMEKLAEAEGYVVLINRAGGIEFRPRSARQGSSQFSFYGQGFARQNVVEIEEYKEAWDKFYNFFRLKYLEADTTTSFVSAGTNTSVGISNTSWLYGSRVYEFENRLTQNTTQAQNIVNNLFSIASSVPQELTDRCVFVPHLELLDRVDENYRSYDLGVNSIWDVFYWDSNPAGQPQYWGQDGVNFDLNVRPFFIVSQKHDLDNFTTTFQKREI